MEQPQPKVPAILRDKIACMLCEKFEEVLVETHNLDLIKDYQSFAHTLSQDHRPLAEACYKLATWSKEAVEDFEMNDATKALLARFHFNMYVCYLVAAYRENLDPLMVQSIHKELLKPHISKQEFINQHFPPQFMPASLAEKEFLKRLKACKMITEKKDYEKASEVVSPRMFPLAAAVKRASVELEAQAETSGFRCTLQ